MDLRVRPVSHDDCILLYRWLNDPLMRAMSLKQGQIPIDIFKRWFYLLVTDKDVLLLIADLLVDDRWVSIAQVRIHADGEDSISICEEYRGKRLATPIILASLDFAKNNFSISNVFTRIRCDNIPSIRAFERAGFRFNGEITVKNYPCVEYIYEIPT